MSLWRWLGSCCSGGCKVSGKGVWGVGFGVWGEPMAIRTYRQLDVWQRAIELTEEVYRLAAQFPTTERYGLTSQIQRAAVSIAANIAGGYGRTARGDYLQHLSIARGSLMEVETH